MEKWNDVYYELTHLLLKFYKSNKEDSGKILFRKCQSDKRFLKYNEWLVKTKQILKSTSIDPVHIFSSFNRSRQFEEDRIEIINSWFRIFGSKKVIKEIDFAGCPTPFSIKLLSARDVESQSEIWRTFYVIKTDGQNGITEMMFKNIKKWYGIEVPAFTIFLFWIDPNNFLPLDKNSEKLLFEAGIIKSSPRTSYEYANLLPQINTTLYLDVARFGYELSSGETSKSKRSEIQAFIQRLRSVYNRFNKKLHTGGDFNFKIVAIRPLKGSYKRHTKVLELGKSYYSFYKEYDFRKDGKIKINRDLEMSLYNVNGLTINISAIVGKNGSGKSTLSELLYLAINNIAALSKNQKNSDLIFERGLNLELFYTTGTFCRLRLIGKKISITEYETKVDTLYPKRSRNVGAFELSEFFYTIAVNYSHYGLNSLELGVWINKLFHKNDGYQTPLVINPFRKEGNFDINTENELVKSRLLANIVQPIDQKDSNNLRVITDNNKAVTKIRFSPHFVKIGKLKTSRQTKVTQTFNSFLEYFGLSTEGAPQEFIDVAKFYVASKLRRICENYSPYSEFLKKNGNDIYLTNLTSLIAKVDSDPSHITYKIRQVVNYFRYKTYEWYPLNKDIDVEKISQLIEAVKSKESRSRQIKSVELLPPSFYDFEFYLTGGSSFQKLSSGEKQRIYTVSSIIYHLYNIDSVSEGNDLVIYPFVNIAFDEIELYFHPEMQRKFVNYFLEYLKRTSLDNIIALNFCFITHSPFILSDIPSQNILFLNQNGKPNEILNENNTLGGNIHDLLANNFFLENGYMGEHANRLIQSLLSFLSPNEVDGASLGRDSQIKWSKELAKKFIECIGEPLIRNSLKELFLIKYKTPEIDKEIERLQKLKAKLQ
jgi:energy-coupling factor transporter ATP-binding protein EcfA2